MRYDAEAERFYLARMYAEAVQAAGGVPVHVPLIPEPAYLTDLLGRLDGVLLPGSASDVEPKLYGHEPHQKLGAVHALRDETDMILLEEVERRSIPLLAICYGMQVWNVHRGGTLIQDIASEAPEALKHEQGAPRDRRSHKIRVAVSSKLANFTSEAEMYVNSHHHQALNAIGRGLRAVAWTSDNLVEAVEDTREGCWALGVQWHPEIAWSEDHFSQAIFRGFVNAAQDYSDARVQLYDDHLTSVR